MNLVEWLQRLMTNFGAEWVMWLLLGLSVVSVAIMLEHRDALKPLAIGANKVLFQKRPVTFDLNADFSSAFPFIPKNTTTLWGEPVHLFDFGLLPFVDLGRSTPARRLRLRPT